MKHSLFRTLLAGAALFATSAQAAYPDKTIRLVVPYAAGGSVDAVARVVASELSQRLGESIVVDNRGGASGNIGANLVAKAAPDGYTLLVHNASSVAANVSAFKSLPFDPRKDLRAVAKVANQPGVLVANPALPVNSVGEFLEYVQKHPNTLHYGVGGLFSPTHTAAVLFSIVSGARIEPVMYKGAAPAMIDLVSGQIDFMFDNAPTSLPFIKEGRIKALAVTAEKRIAALPDTPTFLEAGLKDYVFNSWIGVSAPTGTPEAVLDMLNGALNQLVSEPAFQQRMEALGLEASAPMSRHEFGQYIAGEVDLYSRIVKASGIDPM